jgi:hypothetical protein
MRTCVQRALKVGAALIVRETPAPSHLPWTPEKEESELILHPIRVFVKGKIGPGKTAPDSLQADTRPARFLR